MKEQSLKIKYTTSRSFVGGLSARMSRGSSGVEYASYKQENHNT